MPTYVNPAKCDGCKAHQRPACMYICPMDLMKLDSRMGKSYNQEPDLCWECYARVEICPQGAIEVRAGADVQPMGATLTPLRGTDSIVWTARYRDGRVKQSKFPIRTTPWGSMEPHPAHRRPKSTDLKAPGLFGEEAMLGIEGLPHTSLARPKKEIH